ncbi:hypothetical protein K438DRAFT_1762852 [Mycena galopus ATCC 62051]|nr:hypothetical protein K438DRAFT_1762852 [Mycena galopus ATCC 62051]
MELRKIDPDDSGPTGNKITLPEIVMKTSERIYIPVVGLECTSWYSSLNRKSNLSISEGKLEGTPFVRASKRLSDMFSVNCILLVDLVSSPLALLGAIFQLVASHLWLQQPPGVVKELAMRLHPKGPLPNSTTGKAKKQHVSVIITITEKAKGLESADHGDWHAINLVQKIKEFRVSLGVAVQNAPRPCLHAGASGSIRAASERKRSEAGGVWVLYPKRAVGIKVKFCRGEAKAGAVDEFSSEPEGIGVRGVTPSAQRSDPIANIPIKIPKSGGVNYWRAH